MFPLEKRLIDSVLSEIKPHADLIEILFPDKAMGPSSFLSEKKHEDSFFSQNFDPNQIILSPWLGTIVPTSL